MPIKHLRICEHCDKVRFAGCVSGDGRAFGVGVVGMKRFIPAAVLVALMLTGCGSTDSRGNERPGNVAPHYVDLPDGRTVLCVWEGSGYGGGLSCDWAGAR